MSLLQKWSRRRLAKKCAKACIEYSNKLVYDAMQMVADGEEIPEAYTQRHAFWGRAAIRYNRIGCNRPPFRPLST